MAIYGVTDRESLDPRFKVLGKLRKGAPKEPNRPGRDLEWFRFTSDNDAVVKAFRQAYGDQPVSLQAFFPFPTLEAVFPTFRESYGQNHLLKEQCDGFNIIQWQDGPRMARGSRVCQKQCKSVESRPPCPDCALKPIGRLSVILIPLLEARHVGTVTVETHGWHDISEIARQLAMYEPLTGREFRVYRETTTIGAPIGNKRAAVQKSLVKIEPTQETYKMLLQNARQTARAQLVGGENVPQLEAGQPLTPDMVQEPEEIAIDGDADPGAYDGYIDENDIPFNSEPEPTEKPHWIDCVDKNGREIKKAFWVWTDSLGLTASDVYAALEADSIHKFTGDMQDAKDKIEKYKADHPLPAEVVEAE